MLIFDERSLVSSSVLARCHYNVSNSVYGGVNKECSWGNVPIVLFVGDDFQLPSIDNGCLSIFDSTANLSTEEEVGNMIFKEFAQKVVCLKDSKRQLESEQYFMDVLKRLRCEDPLVSREFFFHLQ